MEQADHSSLTFCDSLEGEEAKERGSSSGGVYRPKEGWHIQDLIENSGRAAGSMVIWLDLYETIASCNFFDTFPWLGLSTLLI